MIQIQGSTGSWFPNTVMDMDGMAFRAMLVTRRPDELQRSVYGPGGMYRIARTSGVLGGNFMVTGAIIFSARWSNPTGLMVIGDFEARLQPLALQTGVLTDATSLDLYVVRNFTTAPIGGTAILSGSPMDWRRMAPSQITEMQIATFRGLLSGAFSPDPHPIAQSLRKPERQKITGSEETIHPWSDGINLQIMEKKGEIPLVLALNEGVILVNRTAWGPSGTAQVLVEMAWSEGPFIGG